MYSIYIMSKTNFRKNIHELDVSSHKFIYLLRIRRPLGLRRENLPTASELLFPVLMPRLT